MNVDLLSQMVYDLILGNDRVTLPGVGTFVAEMVPATFTDRGYTINPPYRKLSFRSSGPADTLLVDLYAASANVSKEVAGRVLGEFLSEMKAVLFAKKTVVFPGLGRLRATRENNIFFVADESLDIFPEGFGLEPLSLKARRETVEDISRSVEQLGEILNGPAVDAVSEPVEAVSEPVDAVSEPVEAEVPEASLKQENVRVEEKKDAKSGKVWRGIVVAAVVLVAIAVVVIGGFIVLAHIAPAFVDSLLYTPEELQIINYRL
ncbi:MAG: hypothetical protein SO114_02445 [Candidatus Cryptobacteroides sp.]|nr:hypothetical protein [Candidatus Cryptobacteroides sp.]